LISSEVSARRLVPVAGLWRRLDHGDAGVDQERKQKRDADADHKLKREH
jgi:hypothetical protein